MSTIHSNVSRRGVMSVSARPTRDERLPITPQGSIKPEPDRWIPDDQANGYGRQLALVLSRERMLFDGCGWQPNWAAAEALLARARQDWESSEAMRASDPLSLPLAEMRISDRTRALLERYNVIYARQLVAMSIEQLLDIRQVSKATLEELNKALRASGLPDLQHEKR